MNKTILILKHEFRQTVKRKGFIIMTLAFPVLALIAIGVFSLIQGIEKPPAPGEEVTIGYVDKVSGFDEYARQPGGITLTAYPTQEAATSALLAEEISEYFIIPPDYVSTGIVTRYTLERELEPPGETQWAIKSFLLSNLLEGQTSPEVTERVKVPMNLGTVRLDETGQVATDQGGFGAFIIPYLFSILLVMAIFTSSGFLLQGLGEEKENRIMEILLSSVSARQLLTGKVLGLGAVGLIQILIWLLSARFLVELVSTTIGGFATTLQIPSNLLILGVVYFILGYLLFAVLMAGVGSISSTTREGQQLSMIFTMSAVIPFIIIPFIMQNPGHIVTQILTLFPITAPITVMIRMGLTNIPAWELALSITLLVVTIIGSLVLAAKVFRTFLLMYGKRPRLREIIRCLREA
ncbi:MAG TPA: ABC transporter permease [Dehalococcoidia bacterium]|nr:ABC transporter permease [Dehalococcoidia bacterium]